jgi:hypothetical protein
VSPVIFEFIGTTFSVIFCAIAIKLADDFLDQDIDTNYNFAKDIGKGTMIYSMLFMACAVCLNVSVSTSLFFASYIIGMFHDLKQQFPSHLSGIQESILVFIIGTFFWGWKTMVFSVLFILSIQLFDDYIDVHTDQLSGHRNWAHRLGNVECFLLFVVSILASWWIGEHMFPPVFWGTVIFYGTIWCYQRGKA